MTPTEEADPHVQEILSWIARLQADKFDFYRKYAPHLRRLSGAIDLYLRTPSLRTPSRKRPRKATSDDSSPAAKRTRRRRSPTGEFEQLDDSTPAEVWPTPNSGTPTPLDVSPSRNSFSRSRETPPSASEASSEPVSPPENVIDFSGIILSSPPAMMPPPQTATVVPQSANSTSGQALPQPLSSSNTSRPAMLTPQSQVVTPQEVAQSAVTTPWNLAAFSRTAESHATPIEVLLERRRGDKVHALHEVVGDTCKEMISLGRKGQLVPFLEHILSQVLFNGCPLLPFEDLKSDFHTKFAEHVHKVLCALWLARGRRMCRQEPILCDPAGPPTRPINDAEYVHEIADQFRELSQVFSTVQDSMFQDSMVTEAKVGKGLRLGKQLYVKQHQMGTAAFLPFLLVDNLSDFIAMKGDNLNVLRHLCYSCAIAPTMLADALRTVFEIVDTIFQDYATTYWTVAGISKEKESPPPKTFLHQRLTSRRPELQGLERLISLADDR